MSSGLKIINDKTLEFHPVPKEEIGLSMYCEGFTLNLNDIRVIALCPRLPLDDERLFILLVDKHRCSYPMPDSVLPSEEIKTIEKKFEIESIREVEWNKIDYDEHYGFRTKVVYPQRLYGKRLYRKTFDNWDTFKKGLSRLIGVSHSTTGIYTDKIENELNTVANKS